MHANQDHLSHLIQTINTLHVKYLFFILFSHANSFAIIRHSLTSIFSSFSFTLPPISCDVTRHFLTSIFSLFSHPISPSPFPHPIPHNPTIPAPKLASYPKPCAEKPSLTRCYVNFDDTFDTKSSDYLHDVLVMSQWNPAHPSDVVHSSDASVMYSSPHSHINYMCQQKLSDCNSIASDWQSPFPLDLTWDEFDSPVGEISHLSLTIEPPLIHNDYRRLPPKVSDYKSVFPHHRRPSNDKSEGLGVARSAKWWVTVGPTAYSLDERNHHPSPSSVSSVSSMGGVSLKYGAISSWVATSWRWVEKRKDVFRSNSSIRLEIVKLMADDDSVPRHNSSPRTIVYSPRFRRSPEAQPSRRQTTISRHTDHHSHSAEWQSSIRGQR